MSNLKLGVEVVSAHDLMPRDGAGSASAYVELHFDGQRFRTTIKDQDLNPVWNESFYFNVSNPASLSELTLEASVYHFNRATQSRSFLGKVQLAGTSFVPFADAVTFHYPLEKRGIFSRVKGELGLKVFLTEDSWVRSSATNPVPSEVDPIFPSNSPTVQGQRRRREYAGADLNPFSENRSDQAAPTSFYNLPREQEQQQQQQQQNQYYSQAPFGEQQPPAGRYGAGEMKPEPPRIMRMFSSASSQQPPDFQIKETSPALGGGRVVGGRVIRGERAGAYDLVEKMRYLFVRVVKARDLPTMDLTGKLDPFVEVRVGNYKGRTKMFEKNVSPEWNEVIAFSEDRLQSSFVEVVLKDKDLLSDDFVGIVRFDVKEIPMRVPPDSPLAPEWYRLEDRKGEKARGELMLAVWYGTQADEVFPYAQHSDAVLPENVADQLSSHIRAKVYHSPRLWYLRVHIIEAQDILVKDRNRFADAFVRAKLGAQLYNTKPLQSREVSYRWNEEHFFVAAEPFEEHLVISVLDRVGVDKDEELGRVHIPLASIARRAEDREIPTSWHNLEKPAAFNFDRFSSKIHLRLCLEGGYHVHDESTHYSSDLRPTARQLWKNPIGLLELGILSADGLHPMKTREGKGTCDTYCVAKYGGKWVRTRTLIGSLSPRFHEQYTWDVHDAATVLTVGVFDNSLHLGHNGAHRDSPIGKVRVRLSTLESGRVYTHAYPLIALHHSGIKKMGELHLAIRFSATSTLNLLHHYSRPHLPKMHYLRPIPLVLQDRLRHYAVQIVAARLARMEPPLRKEVVEHMSDAHAHLWSLRRSKANFFRLTRVFSGCAAVWGWFRDVCLWKNPITTALVHVLFVMLVFFPELILPTVFLYMFLIGAWNYRYRPRYPPHMNIRLSHADLVHPDELDEEFDTFPTTRPAELVRVRYDRLRSVAGRIQTVIGDVATQGERFQSLLSWRDPRATAMFLVFCLCSAVVLYVTPFQVLAVLSGFYIMRHPRFRHRMPAIPLNFFRRLPAKTDSLL